MVMCEQAVCDIGIDRYLAVQHPLTVDEMMGMIK